MSIQNLSLGQGLSSPYASQILQDRQGFLWICTNDGLNRYDGHKFTVFKRVPGEPKSLQDNVLNVVYEDPAGTLWVGANNGLYRYHPDTESFTAYIAELDADVPGKLNGNVLTSILADPAGNLWLSTYSCGLHRFDPTQENFQSFYPDTSWANFSANTFCSRIGASQNNKQFWVAMGRPGDWKLYQVEPERGRLQPFDIEGLPRGQMISSVLEDRRGNVWLGTTAGLWKFDRNAGVCRKVAGASFPPGISQGLITALFEDRSGILWFGTYTDGLYAHDPHNQQTEHYRHDPAVASSLAGNSIRYIMQDRSGVVWVSMIGKGLSKLVPDKTKFHLAFKGKDFPAGLSVSAIFEDLQGVTWVGAGDDLIAWNRKTGHIRRMRDEFPNIALLKNEIYALHEDRHGDLWVGSNSAGLLRMNPERTACKVYKNDPANPASLANNHVRAICEDRNGTLWFGTFNGLDRFDRDKEQFIHYQNDPAQPKSLPDYFVSGLHEDAAGRFWVIPDLGISLMDRTVGHFKNFLRAEQEPSILNSCAVICVHSDRAGALWLGTTSGLYQLVPPKIEGGDWTSARHYTQKDGLPHNKITGIQEDNHGRFWLSTFYGLTVFQNPHHDTQSRPVFLNYDIKSGLSGLEFEMGANHKNSRGELFFGNRSGLNYFHPDSLRNNPHPPTVAITKFEKFDADTPETGAIAEKGIAAKQEIVLSHKNNIFTIEFAALDFREPEKNCCAYRMLGFNDHWIQLGTQRQVTFTNLDPGTYTFQVRGANNDGLWNETPTSLKIIITPPWWMTIWAYSAYILLLIAAVVGFVQARLRYLKNRTRELEQAVARGTAQILNQKEQLEIQADELQKLDRLKSRFYANITHELRTPLTLILGPLNTTLKTLNTSSEQRRLITIAWENGKKLLTLISEILDLGKLDADRMTVEENAVDIRALLARLVAQFDSNAAFRGVQLDCQFDLPAGQTFLLDAPKFETIVNNLMSNALKFTAHGGTVRVAMAAQTDTLLLTVQDTGRGIHPHDLPHIFDRYFQTKQPDAPVEGGTGIGLALCAELVRLAGGRIWAESTPGFGSTFFVEWPKKEVAVENPSPVLQEKIAPPIEAEQFAAPVPFSIESTNNGNGISGVLEKTVSTPAAGIPKILIAEDNPDLQQYLHHILSPVYDVLIVGNGEEALALMEETSPALLISDIMMPRMDGFQLLERLKSADQFRHIPVVMLTARADMQDKLRALRIGVDDYLTKPFEEEELLARVENLLQRQQNRRPENPDEEDKTSATPRISQADSEWLSELEAWTQDNLKDEFLNVGAMAHHAALSERQLLRRLRELTGLSPQQYIAEMRLQKARGLLERGAFRTVAEAAYAAGFGHPKVFSRTYRARFGRLPSAYF